MAPRKSIKSPESTEEKPPVKKAAKPRTRKAAPPEKLPEPLQAAAAVEVAPEPAPRAKRGRKPKAVEAPLAAVPETPASEPAPLAAEAPVPAAEPISLSPQVQAILGAIQEGRAVEFIFADTDANPPRTFEPRQLIFDVFTKAWFAWGWDRRYNAERHHRVDLLAEVNPVEGMGRAAQGPYKEGTPANQVGGWLGGEPIPVKAVLLKQWIYAVKQAPAVFPDFRIEDLEEGKAQVSFVGTDLRAIARWCMQFGDGIQVLEPQRLIDRIKQVGVAWAGKPAQPQPQPQPKSQPKPEPQPKPQPKPEPQKSEHPRHEHREHREPKEAEAPKAKPAKIEIRFDRL